jgi:hypothetical protein
MDLPVQLRRLDQIADGWRQLSPTKRIRSQDYDLMQRFDPQGNLRDGSSYSISFDIWDYRPPRLIGRKMVMRERWFDHSRGLIDGLEIVRLQIDSPGASDEVGILLNGSLHGKPRTVISLGRSAFITAVSPSARLLALLTLEG